MFLWAGSGLVICKNALNTMEGRCDLEANWDFKDPTSTANIQGIGDDRVLLRSPSHRYNPYLHCCVHNNSPGPADYISSHFRSAASLYPPSHPPALVPRSLLRLWWHQPIGVVLDAIVVPAILVPRCHRMHSPLMIIIFIWWLRFIRDYSWWCKNVTPF